MRRWVLFVAARIRQGGRRVGGSFVPILQSAAAAAIAYLIAEQVFGRPAPLFAPIAAWVCLGFKADRVPRKVAELGVGATAGVLIGEFFALWLEVGWWQIGLALLVGALLSRFLDRGDLTTIQGGVNAVVVVSMSWWQALTGGVTGRWIEALVGAGVALVVAALLPRNPTARPRRYARATLTEYATLLGVVGRGLRAGDVQLLADARGQRRAVAELMVDWEETLTTAREVVAINPTLRRYRPEVAELSRVFRLLQRQGALVGDRAQPRDPERLSHPTAPGGGGPRPGTGRRARRRARGDPTTGRGSSAAGSRAGRRRRGPRRRRGA